jgi:tRNA pseudouridine13 synthase
MSESSDVGGRPAKRARYDDTTDTATTISRELPKAPIASEQAAVDGDLEREVRAGITEYVCSDNLGFSGVLKQRYTDFLVNEIGLDGKVLHLSFAGVDKKIDGKKNGVEKQSGESDGAKQEETVKVKEKEAVDVKQEGTGAAKQKGIVEEKQDEKVNEHDIKIEEQDNRQVCQMQSGFGTFY